MTLRKNQNNRRTRLDLTFKNLPEDLLHILGIVYGSNWRHSSIVLSSDKFMSKASPPKDWDKLWLEYNKSLKAWMQSFESLQNATKDVQTKYNDVMAKALKESSDKTMNQFTANWQKSMNKAGIDTFKTIW